MYVRRANTTAAADHRRTAFTRSQDRVAIGVIATTASTPHANWALEHSDFTLFVGSRIGSVVTIGWTFPRITLNRRLAQIDISPEIIANNYENLLSIQGAVGP